MIHTAKNIGEAKKYAQLLANRDGCKWIVYHDSYRLRGSETIVADEFEYKYHDWKLVAAFAPAPLKADADAVYLTPEEKKLVAAVLDPKEPGREFYGGDEQTTNSLWAKLTGKNKKRTEA